VWASPLVRIAPPVELVSARLDDAGGRGNGGTGVDLPGWPLRAAVNRDRVDLRTVAAW